MQLHKTHYDLTDPFIIPEEPAIAMLPDVISEITDPTQAPATPSTVGAVSPCKSDAIKDDDGVRIRAPQSFLSDIDIFIVKITTTVATSFPPSFPRSDGYHIFYLYEVLHGQCESLSTTPWIRRESFCH